jgi:aspartyl-tRNA(Asn)/glutamyl-tRNA(Gln) amidotransferase subunit A
MTQLHEMSAAELVGSIARRDLSPVELVEYFLGRVSSIDPVVRSFVTLDHDSIRREAKQAEQRVSSGEPLGPLHGLPVSVKDLIVTKGIRTTRGSRMFEHDVPSFDAPVVARLKKAGAIVFGKTNTSEFGWKGATSNLIFPETRNPWNLAYSPGGSSGGAAAGVASGLAPVAIGTDGGGSIRIPAAFTGLFGFKPSLGRWPVFPASGVGPLSHIGPIARSVGDAALLDDVLSGFDERDCYSAAESQHFSGFGSSSNLKIGWTSDLGFMRLDSEIASLVEASVHRLEALGHRIIPLKPDIGDPTDTVATYFAAGAAAVVADQPDWKETVDPGLGELIAKHAGLSAVDYARAQLARAGFYAKVAAIFDDVDLIVTPTVPVAGFRLGLDGPQAIAGSEVDRIRWLGLTSLFNLTGHPAASLPIGFSSIGLPVGLQIVGPRGRDRFVLQTCKEIETIFDAPRHWPPAAGIEDGSKVTNALWLSNA